MSVATSLRNLSIEEALAQVRAHAIVTGAEPVPVGEAVGRRLAAVAPSLIDHPTFTNSAMDGYAVRAADTPGTLALVGESRAGAPFDGALAPGQAAVISTGAELPAGADAVLRREDAEERDGRVTAAAPLAPGAFVRHRGEDLGAGDVLLPAGAVVGPHEIAALAAAGHASLACHRRPCVAILGSGDELVPPGRPLGPGQVYDANRAGLAAQATAAGARVVASELARDDRDVTIAAVRGLLDRDPDPSGPSCDLLVTIGGVSVGRHDHLRPALAAAGVEEVFFGVQIRPGHPLFLGRLGEQRILGLPGNPVSAAVCFQVFGRVLLGHEDPWDRTAPLAAPYVKDTPRAELIRCTREGDALRPFPRQASHAVTSLAGAAALAWIPAERTELAAGERVRVMPLR